MGCGLDGAGLTVDSADSAFLAGFGGKQKHIGNSEKKKE